MSIVVYNEVETPIVPIEGLAGRVRDALGDALRSMRYVTPDFAGLYQDAVGTTPVTAVGQPVGLMLDRRFGLVRGPELVPQPIDFNEWDSVGGAAVLAPNSFETTASGGMEIRALVTAGHYALGWEGITSTTAVSIRLGSRSNNSASNANGSGNIITYSSEAGGVYIRSPAGAVTEVLAVSLRELPGNHASQPTTTARPTLRSGPLRIDYDGVDDYLRTVFPDLGDDVTIARSIPGVGAQILTGQTIAAGEWDDSVDSCATLVIDRALTGPETALVTAFLNQQAGV